MASTGTMTFNMTYTPPGAPLNSGTFSKTVSFSYTAMTSGIMDIPDATVASTVFPIPFGTINANAQVLIVFNMNNKDIGIRLNGSVTDIYQIPPGGMLTIGSPTTSTSNPLTSAAVTTTALQVGTGTVEFFVLGI
jgi:hypothetical protein